MTTKEFQKLHDEIRALKEKEEFDKMMAYYADDCVVLTPMSDPLNKKQMRETVAAKGGKNTNQCDAVTVAGSIAIDRGTITFVLPTGNKYGYYLCVWRNEGGKWKIFNFCIGAKREATNDFQKLHDELKALKEKDDFDKMLEHFTDDSCFMTPMHDPMNKKQMKEAHANPSKEMLAAKGAKSSNHCDAVTLAGDLAIDRGTIKWSLPTGEKHGYYLCVWRNEGGKWKIFNLCIGGKKECT